uniref:Uroplakin 3B n=1 Tax=Cyanistes caeruleus TaxID=156563 RepID=A0A8C0VDJ2_CYACU
CGAADVPPLLWILFWVSLWPQLQYRPVLTQDPRLEGQITASTFVLDQPRCVFQDYGNADIWLVVALDQAVSTFNTSAGPGTSETAFQSFPDPVRAYMTLNATLGHYPCPKPDGEITVLRVGSETSCAQDVSRPTCNGPLPGPGPYRVKFLALEGSVPVAETAWSAQIMLRTGTAAGGARPSPRSRRGGIWGGPGRPLSLSGLCTPASCSPSSCSLPSQVAQQRLHDGQRAQRRHDRHHHHPLHPPRHPPGRAGGHARLLEVSATAESHPACWEQRVTPASLGAHPHP